MTRSTAWLWLVGQSAGLMLLAGVRFGVAAGAESSGNARELFAQAQASYHRISAYQCEVTSFARQGDRSQTVRLEFAFKKPGMLRARVLGGSNRGSEVAIRRDGKIRGHQGGLLRAIKVTMSRDDRRLRNIRGAPVWEADWGAFLDKFASALAQHPVEAVVHPGEEGTLVADLRLNGVTGLQRQVYTVDKTSYLLRGAELYEGDVLVTRVSYAKERLNPDLPDGYFSM